MEMKTKEIEAIEKMKINIDPQVKMEPGDL